MTNAEYAALIGAEAVTLSLAPGDEATLVAFALTQLNLATADARAEGEAAGIVSGTAAGHATGYVDGAVATAASDALTHATPAPIRGRRR